MTLDLFAGIGGWQEGLRRIKPDLVNSVVGFEWDGDACATSTAAGHRTVRADVTTWPLDHLGPVEGITGGPPCQTFSAAGNGEGRDDIDRLVHHAHHGELLETPDPRTGLVLEPLRWIQALRPRWVALEQVPAVAPVWHAYEHHLRTLGYATWSGVCNAANHGVPQTRRRAILLASLDRRPQRPVATHQRDTGGMFGLSPWVSMADALGWDDTWGTGQETARGAGMSERHGPRPVRAAVDPSEVISSKTRSWCFERPGGRPRWWWRDEADERYGDRAGTEAVRLTVADALTLQDFPPDYPVQGSRTAAFRQVGNAIPPGLAAAVLKQVAA